ncbi:sugar transporter [Ignatzschineria ureiclastica]|uniref:Sugar transporter n=1 Tax=Ignatzschineria ureiclastica TaxID=472582 RepID=A0A2U2AFS3_9GAMM|nr:polysaccharide biosynthesis/export family protein [Ignatzschineria ureiclastica]PWD81505.1 sugar transporter [Ignatzschineria ureiclastica]GHA01162.1 capsular polysaccharide export protein [Ignatzschineria ureiclastica]
MVLTACSGTLSAAGPGANAIRSQGMDQQEPQIAGGYEFIELKPSTIAQYMRPQLTQLKKTVSKPAIPELYLTPGDVISVMISDSAEDGALFAPLSAGGTVFEKVRLNSQGAISLPYVGSLSLRGLTTTQAEAKIREQLKRYVTDPQVFINITGDLGGSILVAGDVNKPGRYSTLEGPLTLLDVVNLAGGPKLEPYLVDVVVRNGQQVSRYNYEDLLNGMNHPISANTEVVVERAKKRFVAMGAVQKPGLHDFPSKSPTLLDALGTIGGLSEQKANASGVFVFRLADGTQYDSKTNTITAKEKPQVFQLNLKDPTSMFVAQQFLVQPEDAIYVTNAATYEFQKLISPIIQVLVLGNTVSN